MYRALTEVAVVAHLLFILFVIGGGFLARRRRWSMFVHLSALAWAVYAEISPGVVCPLTTLENFFAQQAGLASYKGDFVTHYLVPVIYQDELASGWQYVLVAVVIGINVAAYVFPKKAQGA
jgi:glucan phosphoethanolaminetransferase (alkaline phosphatase superfamily)